MRHQNQFGPAFKAVRLALKMTQEDFAHESGRTYISELERGRKQPTLQKVDELAVPLGVHPLTLLFLSYLANCEVSSLEPLLEQVKAELGKIITLEASPPDEARGRSKGTDILDIG